MAADLKVLEFPTKPEQKKKRKLRKYEREDGRFCKRVMVSGKSYLFYGTSTRDVQQQADAFKELMKHGLNATDYDITVREWSIRWFDAEMEGKEESYRLGTQRQLDIINEHIGDMKVRDVRELHLIKIVNSRAGFSKSQINKIHNITQRLFSSARKNHIIIIDPSLDLKKPKGTYEGHRALESWEIDLLLKHYSCAPAGLWAITMMLSGLRREECLALDRSSFNFEKATIHVSKTVTFTNGKSYRKNKTKTQASLRDTPMLEPLTGIIKASFSQSPRTLFATQVCGDEINESSYTRQWETLLRRLTKINSGYSPNKFPPKNKEAKARFIESLKPVHFTPHDLRYTYATILYDAGVDEKTAQRWLGHTSPEMTRDLYAKLTAERKARSDRHLIEYFKRFTQSDTRFDTNERNTSGNNEKFEK